MNLNANITVITVTWSGKELDCKLHCATAVQDMNQFYHCILHGTNWCKTRRRSSPLQVLVF